MAYPFESIWINGRDVRIHEIIEAIAIAENTFEQNVFAFIQDWFSDTQTFSLQTSGSTGDPKTIRVTRDQMITSASLTERALNLLSGYTALLCLDPKFIAGKMMLVRSFVTGMRIIAVNPSVRILDQIPVASIDFAAMVPYQIQEILESPMADKLNNIKAILVGGAPLNEKVQKELTSIASRVYVTYGMTETISHVALRLVSGKNADDHFKVLPGITIRLDDRDCLVIRAPHIPEEVITNDIAEIVGLYGFRWLGRWDNVINTGGIKVIPEQIEKVIDSIFKELGINNEFFVAGLPDPKLNQRVSLIVAKILTPYQKDQVLQLCRQKIQLYAAPKELICLEKFYLTENGKVNRQKTVENITKRP